MAQVSKLTIDSSKIAADLTDFPVYVDLSDMNAEFWATVANGGGDIRVFKSDGTTELPREVVSCDTGTETGELHFKYTGTLSSSSDTEIQIHADGVSSDYATTDTYGAENVWNSNYKAVYHLKDANDSTSNGNDGTVSGATSGAIGKIGEAYDFDGSNDKIDLGEIDSFNTPNTQTELTISAWIKADSTSGQGHITRYGASVWVWIFRINSDALQAYIRESTGDAILASYAYTDITNKNYVVMSYGGDGVNRLYINGTEVSTATGDGTLYNTPDDNAVIGSSDILDTTTVFNGIIDETRISNIGKSADWITTEYNNQNSPSTFYTATAAMLTVNITDTMSLLETTTLPRSLLFSQTDTIEMTDSASLLKVIFVNIVETIGLSEATSSVRSRVISIIDSLGLDEIARARKKIRNLSKNIATGITNRVKNSMIVKNRSKS